MGGGVHVLTRLLRCTDRFARQSVITTTGDARRSPSAGRHRRLRASIGELIGAPVRGFAYPYGSMDTAATRAVRYAGYDYACAIEPPMAALGIMALPRIGVCQRDSPRRLAALHGHITFEGRHLEGRQPPYQQVDNG